MRKICLIWMLCLCLLSFQAAGDFGLAQAMNGRELAKKIYNRYIGDNSFARAKMILVGEDGDKRIRDMTIMMIEEDGSRKNLIRFTSPSDIAGTGFLSIENEEGSTDQFLYLPALDRTRRIVASQRGRSFVNSDFTYEDMQRRPVQNYEHEVTGEEVIQGLDCWILEERPLPEANSKYSLIKNWVPKDMPLPIQAYFFDDKGKHIKTYKVTELKKIQNIWTPMQMVMVDHGDQHRTIWSTQDIKYNSPDIQESFFSTRYLENW